MDTRAGRFDIVLRGRRRTSFETRMEGLWTHGRRHPWAGPDGWLPEGASRAAGPCVHNGCVRSRAGPKGTYGGRDLGAATRRDGHAGEAVTLEGPMAAPGASTCACRGRSSTRDRAGGSAR